MFIFYFTKLETHNICFLTSTLIDTLFRSCQSDPSLLKISVNHGVRHSLQKCFFLSPRKSNIQTTVGKGNASCSCTVFPPGLVSGGNWHACILQKEGNRKKSLMLQMPLNFIFVLVLHWKSWFLKTLTFVLMACFEKLKFFIDHELRCWLVFISQTQTRFAWEEGASVKALPPSD